MQLTRLNQSPRARFSASPLPLTRIRKVNPALKSFGPAILFPLTQDSRLSLGYCLCRELVGPDNGACLLLNNFMRKNSALWITNILSTGSGPYFTDKTKGVSCGKFGMEILLKDNMIVISSLTIVKLACTQILIVERGCPDRDVA